MEIILTPPIAFLIYVPFVILLLLFGKGMAGKSDKSALRDSVYASGEEASTTPAAPGYKPFFLIAFFFAILHMSMLIIGSGTFSLQTVPYLLGVMVSLIALLLG
jgi:NADH:ubiquinone oxidoreductase subunit 3 (subunit A)